MNDITATILILVLLSPAIVVLVVLMARGVRRLCASGKRARRLERGLDPSLPPHVRSPLRTTAEAALGVLAFTGIQEYLGTCAESA